MDPKHSAEMSRHLDKQNHALMETYRAMSHELHKLQVEEETIMQKLYELMSVEGLLPKPDYDALVDTWSLGCVMAEMLTGKTLFHDDDDDDHKDEFNDTTHIVQLWSIFRVLGTPDERTWPEFASLPLTAKALQLLPAGHKNNTLRDIFPEERLSEQGFQVLQGLLTCNPDKRLTAAKALKHPWFAAPRPAAAAAKAETLTLPKKKMPGFMVALAVLKAQRV